MKLTWMHGWIDRQTDRDGWMDRFFDCGDIIIDGAENHFENIL